ncbi:transporter substrate-binding domain-containing protein [Roseomonas sp. OT10]|uniref:substrate-binding periplasmic protein n=1 Tax=Roseomonas cutis TaxID=2897332 RepID=UPI001E2BEFE9|nr:transporter substrate-binding domain-containing protein [Roseomonas sp. OT10]UFN48521.1 transporter substrate-binding domain-containing protein [Roseomonas sp. OT10]
MPSNLPRLSRRQTLLAAGALAPASAMAQGRPLGGGTVPSNIVLCGTSLTLAPFSFINEKGDSVGFELDILTAVGQKLGIEFRYVRVPFSQNFTSLNAGIFRISAASAFMTCPRLLNPQGVGEYTVPTYASGQSISTRPDLAPRIKSMRDLAGLKVGIESIGSTSDKLADETLKTVRFEKVVFPDNPSLFLALEQRRIDAAVQSEFPALWQTRGNPAVVLAARVPETYFPVGYLLRQGDPLREEVNRAIDALKGEGKLAEIYRQWFQADPDPDGPTVKVVPTVTAQSRGCAA